MGVASRLETGVASQVPLVLIMKLQIEFSKIKNDLHEPLDCVQSFLSRSVSKSPKAPNICAKGKFD